MMVKAAAVKEAKAASNAVMVKAVAVKAASNAVMAKEVKGAKAASNAVMTVDRDWALWHLLCNQQGLLYPAALLPAEITTGTKTAANTAAMTTKPENPYRISQSAFQPMYRRMTILCLICQQQEQPR